MRQLVPDFPGGSHVPFPVAGGPEHIHTAEGGEHRRHRDGAPCQGWRRRGARGARRRYVGAVVLCMHRLFAVPPRLPYTYRYIQCIYVELLSMQSQPM